MKNYARILVAIDYSDHGGQVLERALQLAADHDAALHLVHVVEYLPPMVMGEEPFPSADWVINEEQLLENARQQMQTIAAGIAALSVTRHVLIGTPRHELCRIAEQEKVDLVVSGSHGRHGVARILGSTASGLMHHLHCDLLLVRIAG